MIKEAKTIIIDRKIFTKEDLKSISKIFINENQSSTEKGNSITLKFTYNFIDNTSIESISLKAFEEHGLLDMKKSSQIDFTFFDHSDDKYMNFNITHGNNGSNRIIIRGTGETWTRHITTLFNDELEALKPQSNFTKHNNLIAVGLSIIISFIIGFYSFKILGKPIITKIFNNTTSSEFTMLMSPIWFIGSVIAWPLMTWLTKLWPSIEFDFGPEHMRLEKKKKNRLWIVFSVFIVPIIIAIFMAIFF